MEDSAILPLYNGRIVSWLVAAEGSVVGVLSDARYVLQNVTDFTHILLKMNY